VLEFGRFRVERTWYTDGLISNNPMTLNGRNYTSQITLEPQTRFYVQFQMKVID